MNGWKVRTQRKMIVLKNLGLFANFSIFRVLFVFRLLSCLFRVSTLSSRVCIDIHETRNTKHETRNTRHEVFVFRVPNSRIYEYTSIHVLVLYSNSSPVACKKNIFENKRLFIVYEYCFWLERTRQARTVHRGPGGTCSDSQQ